jgi:hypothetical protein
MEEVEGLLLFLQPPVGFMCQSFKLGLWELRRWIRFPRGTGDAFREPILPGPPLRSSARVWEQDDGLQGKATARSCGSQRRPEKCCRIGS